MLLVSLCDNVWNDKIKTTTKPTAIASAVGKLMCWQWAGYIIEAMTIDRDKGFRVPSDIDEMQR